ncbi:MAG: OmpA family protein, partial [Ignavibacteriales bacterium]
TDDSKASLDKLVNVLNGYPDTTIEVQGHTDSKRSEAYNQTLSVDRANVVSRYLGSNNLNASRVTIKGFGETIPKYDNGTADGRTQNRRVEFLISANEKMIAEAKKEASK